MPHAHHVELLAQTLKQRPYRRMSREECRKVLYRSPQELLEYQWPRLHVKSKVQYSHETTKVEDVFHEATIYHPPQPGEKHGRQEKITSQAELEAHPLWALFCDHAGGIPGFPAVIRDGLFDAAWVKSGRG